MSKLVTAVTPLPANDITVTVDRSLPIPVTIAMSLNELTLLLGALKIAQARLVHDSGDHQMLLTKKLIRELMIQVISACQ